MPKQTNGERLMALETKMDSIKDDVSEIKHDLKEHTKWEAEKYDTLDDKYAHKHDVSKIEDRLESHITKQGDDDSYWKKNAFNMITISIMTVIALITYLK